MPHTGIPVFDASYKAFGDLRSNQYFCVVYQAANVVQIASGGTTIPCGVLQNNPNSGEEAVVRHVGMTKMTASSSITAGVLVGPGANGGANTKAAGTDTTNYVIGMAVETFNSGDIRSVIIRGTPFRAA